MRPREQWRVPRCHAAPAVSEMAAGVDADVGPGGRRRRRGGGRVEDI